MLRLTYTLPAGTAAITSRTNRIEPRMHAERQPIALRRKRRTDLRDLGRIVAHDMQDVGPNTPAVEQIEASNT